MSEKYQYIITIYILAAGLDISPDFCSIITGGYETK